MCAAQALGSLNAGCAPHCLLHGTAPGASSPCIPLFPTATAMLAALRWPHLLPLPATMFCFSSHAHLSLALYLTALFDELD